MHVAISLAAATPLPAAPITPVVHFMSWYSTVEQCPPMRGSASVTSVLYPLWARQAAAHIPPIPEPITRTSTCLLFITVFRFTKLACQDGLVQVKGAIKGLLSVFP
jgi:hypothetical protein